MANRRCHWETVLQGAGLCILGVVIFGMTHGTAVYKVWYADADGDGYSEGTSVLSDTSPGAGYVTEESLLVGSAYKLELRAFLGSAYDHGNELMNDIRRQSALDYPEDIIIPTSDPYTALGYDVYTETGAILPPGVLSVAGNDAFVDRVLIEFRDASDPSHLKATKSAYIQRDGDIMDLDGNYIFVDANQTDSYYIAVKQRNHMRVMTANPVAIGSDDVLVDFTNPSTEVYGTNSQREIDGITVMRAGDVNNDNDIDQTDWNMVNDGVSLGEFGGYLVTDVYLDGFLDGNDLGLMFSRNNLFSGSTGVPAITSSESSSELTWDVFGDILRGDCDDADAAIHPGAEEICDISDNDCDTLVDDEDSQLSADTVYYVDSDGDGFGTEAVTTNACSVPVGYSVNNTDCDDTDATKHPATRWYKDEDGDGFGGGDPIQACQQPAGYVTKAAFLSGQAYPLTIKVIIGGAFNTGVNLMRDDLRVAGVLPVEEPYSAMGFTGIYEQGLEVGTGVFTVSGVNAIVDRIVVEFRNSSNSGNIVSTKLALVQRDGDVVDENGETLYISPEDAGNYYIAIRHRNHHGVMTATPRGIGTGAVTINFTTGATSTYGNHAQQTLGNFSGLRAGDVNKDGAIKYSASPSDSSSISTQVSIHSGNISNDPAYTGYAHVYSRYDVNLDSNVFNTAVPSDLQLIVSNVTNYPGNVLRPASYSAHLERVPATTSVHATGAIDRSRFVSLYTNDCDDTDETVFPGSDEVCDEVDNDCDDLVDEGVTTTFYKDTDGDGYTDGVTADVCTVPDGYVIEEDVEREELSTATVDIKVFLGGAYESDEELMRDNLRVQDILPLTEPYSGLGFALVEGTGTTVDASVFDDVGDDSIVDRILIEFRDANDSGHVVSTRLGFVQRDGDVSDVDRGDIEVPATSAGAYYVSVRHRNHLGVMTASPVSVGNSDVVIDFTNPSTQTASVNQGVYAQRTVGSKKVLRPGDVNHDGKVYDVSAPSDSDEISFRVLIDEGNFLFDDAYDGIVGVYESYDVNMDGNVYDNFSLSDRGVVSDVVVNHDGNVSHAATYGYALAQLPDITTIASESLIDRDSGMGTILLDCNDAAETVNPGSEEICDKLDNDCNGQIDDILACREGRKGSSSVSSSSTVSKKNADTVAKEEPNTPVVTTSDAKKSKEEVKSGEQKPESTKEKKTEKKHDETVKTHASAAIQGTKSSETAPSFVDVPKNTPYSEAVHFLQEKGVVQGTADAQNPEEKRFEPYRAMTRGELYKMVVELMYSDEQVEEGTNRADNYAEFLKEKEVISSYSDSELHETVTLNQMLEVLVAVLKAQGTLEKDKEVPPLIVLREVKRREAAVVFYKVMQYLQ